MHPHIKDEILGHASTDMICHETNALQAALIEAINKPPVINERLAQDWMKTPIKLVRRRAAVLKDRDRVAAMARQARRKAA